MAALRSHLLLSTYELLTAAHRSGTEHETLDHLANEVVNLLGAEQDPDSQRVDWAHAAELPAYIRALALWSSPSLPLTDPSLATDLFEKVGQAASKFGSAERTMSNLLSLLDLAVTVRREAGDRTMSLIRTSWSAAYRPWAAAYPDYRRAARMLINALARSGSARTQLRTNPAYRQSRCKAWLDAKARAV